MFVDYVIQAAQRPQWVALITYIFYYRLGPEPRPCICGDTSDSANIKAKSSEKGIYLGDACGDSATDIIPIV